MKTKLQFFPFPAEPMEVFDEETTYLALDANDNYHTAYFRDGELHVIMSDEIAGDADEVDVVLIAALPTSDMIRWAE